MAIDIRPPWLVAMVICMLTVEPAVSVAAKGQGERAQTGRWQSARERGAESRAQSQPRGQARGQTDTLVRVPLHPLQAPDRALTGSVEPVRERNERGVAHHILKGVAADARRPALASTLATVRAAGTRRKQKGMINVHRKRLVATVFCSV